MASELQCITSHSLDDSAKALNASSEQIAGSADKQQHATSAMAAALEELAVGVSSIADNAKEAASMTHRSDEVAVEGGHNVEQTMLSIETIAGTVRIRGAKKLLHWRHSRVRFRRSRT